jgi:hypothetical protein
MDLARVDGRGGRDRPRRRNRGRVELYGLWWLDPLAAFVVAGAAIREGVQSWRGEGCCAVC